MGLNNVKVKESVLEIAGTGKIEIDLDKVASLVDLNKGCRFTPKGVLDFCRSFKVNKDIYPEPVYTSNSVRNLHEVFASSVPNSYDYAVLAHILLAQGKIKSKIVNVVNPKDGANKDYRAFVIFADNGTTYVLDSAVDDIVELEEGKPYNKKGTKYQQVEGNYRMVSVKDVPDYDPSK